MSTFTMQLKRVIKATGGTLEIANGISKMTGGNIGLNDYVIFDEDYRDTLNGKIIDHYMNCEIGTETIEMFQLAMRRKMNEIMPLVNKYFLSQQIEFDPLSTIDLRTVIAGNATQISEGNSETASTSNSTAKSRAVNSETPQTMLSGNGDYATTGADANSSSDNTATGNQNSTDSQNSENNTESNITGYQGVASDLIIRYRDSLINVDMMVISELEELFMLVWDNGDNYTNNDMKGILI